MPNRRQLSNRNSPVLRKEVIMVTDLTISAIYEEWDSGPYAPVPPEEPTPSILRQKTTLMQATTDT